MPLLIKHSFLLIASLWLLQGCAGISLDLVSYPILEVPQEKNDEKIYNLKDSSWILNKNGLEILVVIDNNKIVESGTKAFFIPINTLRERSPNIGNTPFIITLGEVV